MTEDPQDEIYGYLRSARRICAFGMIVMLAGVVELVWRPQVNGSSAIMGLSISFLLMVGCWFALGVQASLYRWKLEHEPVVLNVDTTTGEIAEPVDPFVELAERYAAGAISADDYAKQVAELIGPK